jgi:hypothetical protein
MSGEAWPSWRETKTTFRLRDEQARERVPEVVKTQLRPLIAVELRSLHRLLQSAPCGVAVIVAVIERRADLGGEDEIVLAPKRR